MVYLVVLRAFVTVIVASIAFASAASTTSGLDQIFFD